MNGQGKSPTSGGNPNLSCGRSSGYVDRPNRAKESTPKPRGAIGMSQCRICLGQGKYRDKVLYTWRTCSCTGGWGESWDQDE